MYTLYTEHYLLSEMQGGEILISPSVGAIHISINCPFRQPFLIDSDKGYDIENNYVFKIDKGTKIEAYYIGETHNIEYDSGYIDNNSFSSAGYNVEYEISNIGSNINLPPSDDDGTTKICFNKSCLPPETIITITYLAKEESDTETSGSNPQTQESDSTSSLKNLQSSGIIKLPENPSHEISKQYIYNCDLQKTYKKDFDYIDEAWPAAFNNQQEEKGE